MNTRLNRTNDVFDPLHSLQYNRHLRNAQKPRDILPTQTWVNKTAYRPRSTLTPIHGITPLLLHRTPHIAKLTPHILLPPPQLRRIDGNEQALTPPLLRMLHNPLRNLPILIHVQLQPLCLVAFAGIHDLVEGAGCERWYHLHDVVFLCAAGEDDFAFGVAEFA